MMFWCRRRALCKRAVVAALFLQCLLLMMLLMRRLTTSEKVLCNDTKAPYLTYFVLDGVGSTDFEELISSGELPFISSLVSEGLFIKKAITSFPSVTGYAFIPFISGQDSAVSGIAGLRWLDRTKGSLRVYVGTTNKNMDRDLTDSMSTIFEMFPRDYSYSLQSYMSRGVAEKDLFSWQMATAKFRTHWIFTIICSVLPWFCSTWSQYESGIIDQAIANLGKHPKIQLIVFASPDGIHHTEGRSANFLRSIKLVDSFIGRYMTALRKLNFLENRYIAVVADHGMVNVSRNISPSEGLLAVHGLLVDSVLPSTVFFSPTLKYLSSRIKKYDIIQCVNGNNMAQLYLKSVGRNSYCKQYPDEMNSWRIPPCYDDIVMYPSRKYPEEKINVPHFLAETEGIEFVAFRGPSPASVRVISYSGESEIISDDVGRSFSYQILSGVDPLDCCDSSLQPSDKNNSSKLDPKINYDIKSPCDFQSHSDRSWLELTFFKKFPYAPVRLWRYLHSSQATSGDIIITSKTGYDFGKNYEFMLGNYRGGHGGLRKDQTQVPAIIVGPGISGGTVMQTATTEDIGRTIIQLMISYNQNFSNFSDVFGRYLL